MKKTWLILVVIALVSGCSEGKTAEADRKTEPKEVEKTESKADIQKEKYLSGLKEEMERLDQTTEEVQEMEADPVVIAGKIKIELDLPIAMIEELEPPEEWAQKHEEILAHLRTAKHTAGEAMDLYTKYEFDEGHQMIRVSGESVGRAQKIYTELLAEE